MSPYPPSPSSDDPLVRWLVRAARYLLEQGAAACAPADERGARSGQGVPDPGGVVVYGGRGRERPTSDEHVSTDTIRDNQGGNA